LQSIVDGLSARDKLVIVPGGGTALSSSPEEKMYVVLDGTLHLSNGESEISLERWDSSRIPLARTAVSPTGPSRR
jgi:hypothetical protein